MKKFFMFAAVAALTVVACNKQDNNPAFEGNPAQAEIAFVNASTRGYVEGATFVDSPYDKLHGQTPDGKSDRTLQLSAYLLPQSGEAGNYFVDQTFSKNANGETDNLWHHNPKIYWPMGGQLSFLAYSVTKPFSATAVTWDSANAAEKLTLDVADEYLQDDILFSSVASRASGASAVADPVTPASTVAMTFKHAQAWIQFQIKTGDADMADIVHINDITIKDLYTRGELILTNNGGDAKMEWNFNKYSAGDKKMDDTYEVTKEDQFINATVQYMDMLIPAQKQTQFVMHYTLAGQANELEYTYDLATAQWQAGKKYIYEITFRPYEITVTPSVTAFDAVDPGATGFPSNL